MSTALALAPTIPAPPIPQQNHRYIDNAIFDWLNIHFGKSLFGGRIVLGNRKKGKRGTYILAVRDVRDLSEFIAQMHISNKLNYYITANSFAGVARRKRELFALRNIVIDIDCHDEDKQEDLLFAVEALIWRMERDLWSTGILPRPNSIVRTGRGIQLWWAIEPCYGGRKGKNMLDFYNKAKRVFVAHIETMMEQYTEEEISALKVDRPASKNNVGFYRLPCTYNTAVNRRGQLEILHSNRYNVIDLARIQFPEDYQDYEYTHNYTHIDLADEDISLLRDYGLQSGLRRVLQITRLRRLRNKSGGGETRNDYIFALYNCLRGYMSHDEVMNYVKSFNAGFRDPLTDNEIANTLTTAIRIGGYKYSNDALIDLLSITVAEQEAIGLHPNNGYYVRTKPNAARDEARRAIKETRDNKIISLWKDGVSQAKIARDMHIGKNTVNRVVGRWRKEQDTQTVIEEPIITLVENTKDVEPRKKIKAKKTRHQNGSIYGLLNMPPLSGGLLGPSTLSNISLFPPSYIPMTKGVLVLPSDDDLLDDDG